MWTVKQKLPTKKHTVLRVVEMYNKAFKVQHYTFLKLQKMKF
jgi:hypothetical protein